LCVVQLLFASELDKVECADRMMVKINLLPFDNGIAANILTVR
jgi:hypothetical protein